MALYLTHIILTALAVLAAFLIAYRKSRDPFHPLVLMVPMFLSLYVFLPLKLLHEDTLASFFSYDQLEFVQLVNLFGVASFCLGCLIADRGKVLHIRTSFQVSRAVRKRIIWGALALGSLGVSAYVYEIMNVGGLFEAYGQAYGGGWSDIGYIRDAVFLCVPAIVFIFAARTGQKLSGLERIACILFATPFLVQGFLGARRGPTFLVFAAIGLSWYMMRSRRPRLLVLVTAGLSLGLLLLFLVSNRGSFYLGSDWQFDNPLTQYLEAETGSEYIYGSGSILHAAITDDYYWGRRYFAVVFIRPIPRQLWPDKYEAVGMGQIEENLGTGGSDFLWTLGWAGASGAAPGIVADLWIEVWWMSLVVLYGIGWAYGRAWRSACTKGGFYTVIYVLMASLSIFFVFQTLEAMLVRFLFMVIPSWFIWKWAVTRWSIVSLPANSGLDADRISRWTEGPDHINH